MSTQARSTSVSGDVAVAQAIGDVVETQWGAVRGETVTEIGLSARIFRGVPYAAPPVGELRWQPPQPAEPCERVRDATEWPNRCPQGQSSMGTGSPISEDCLYLNVVLRFCPSKRSDSPAPAQFS
jgi:para-nitrobenzyl esterase